MERIILKGGLLVDPANHIMDETDLMIEGDRIAETGPGLTPEKGDRVIDCSGMEIWPGLIDMHLHVSDLFEIHTNTAYGAAEDGVTTAFSPGAGNTFMAPALLGAEMDRGLPINTGVYVGAANVLGTMLDTDELVRLFRGTLSDSIKEKKLSRNKIVNRTARYVIGIKEHMGHFLLSDDRIRQLYEITDRAGLMFMSHTQDIEHTMRLCGLAEGKRLHLGHANAVGCGTHGDAAEAMKEIIRLLENPNFTGEFVTTMLRENRGSLEGLKMDIAARELALQALEDGKVKILVSDGQNQSVMKGFGDTRDNIPCILELTEMGVLRRMDAVALMTCNPAELLTERTDNEEWKRSFGHAGKGAYANLTVVSPEVKRAAYVFTNGRLVSFESRYLRSAGKAGFWVSGAGVKKDMGIGDMPIYKKEQKGEN